MTNQPKIEYTTDYKSRLNRLTNPKKEDAMNSLVVSNIIREMEIAMILPEAEKQLADSELIQKSIGRNLIFIAEVANCHDNGQVEFINLTVVAETFGDYRTPLRTSMSSLVAEKITLKITDFSFENITGKILIGTTILFSAYVAKDPNNTTYLTSLKAIEIGLKTFDGEGRLDTLVNFQLGVNTFGFEYYTLENGTLYWNSSRNPFLNKFINRYKDDGDKGHLHRGFERVLNLYDEQTIEDVKKLVNIL